MNLSGISVVVPAFNEATGIASVLIRLTDHLATLETRYDVELVVVDDGSRDETFAVLERFSAEHPGTVTLVRHGMNWGLVAAMRSGAEAARHDTVVFLDADLSYRPEIVEPLVLARREAGAKAALASPYMPGGRVTNVPFVRLAASRGANWFLRRCVRGRLHTLTGMVRAYDRAAFLGLFEAEPAGEFNTWAVGRLLAAGEGVVEIPADLSWPPERYAAASRLSTGDLWRRVVLVVETARTLLRATRNSSVSYPGTFALSQSPGRPYNAKR